MLSKSDVKKCVTFTSNSGPMFIIGSVGIGMLSSSLCGYIILISHILGAIINGLFYKNIDKNIGEKTKLKYTTKNEEINLSKSVLDSIISIVLIGGIIVIAFIITRILNDLKIFSPIIFLLEKIGINKQITSAIINGTMEITKGCLDISGLNASLSLKTIISCAIITFGGLSTTLQAMAFLKNCGITYRFFIKQKITHMIISTIICVILSIIIF